jgi:hypothetical protein
MPEYREYRDGTQTLSGVMAYSRSWTATLGGQSPQEMEGVLVTCKLDPGLVVRVNRLEENLEFWRTGSRLIATLSASLSLLALVLASVGVYGVVSYVVSRRREALKIDPMTPLRYE